MDYGSTHATGRNRNNLDQQVEIENLVSISSENDPSQKSEPKHERSKQSFWPLPYEEHSKRGRSLKRRIFLVLTEPETSTASSIFFWILVVAITGMNLIMMMQTMHMFQFFPEDCRTCGGSVSYLFDDDDSIIEPPQGHECKCPPSPLEWTETTLNLLVYFFTVEWILRVVCYQEDRRTTFQDWFSFLSSTTTILDALAIFPYYAENLNTNGLMSLRLLRLFRVFQLVRLGQYNGIFTSLTAVFFESMTYLKLLLMALFFGAALCGSMIYWLEKGDWEFYEPTQSYEFVRYNPIKGTHEISPFTSIPSTFWWFLVTTTSVGYGDTVPITTPGKYVAAVAMLMGVLVIAFPVSVFSELWHKELQKAGAIAELAEEEETKSHPAMNDNGSLRSGLSMHDLHDPTTLVGAEPPLPRPSRDVSSEKIDTMLHKDEGMEEFVLSRADYLDVVAELRAMRESHQRIQAILRGRIRKKQY